MPRQTFAQIEKLASALPHGRIDDLNFRVQALCASASINAHDTIYDEKEAAEDRFDAVAMSSLENLLCFSDDYDVCKWFVENDVTY
jgi:hypothetical protein